MSWSSYEGNCLAIATWPHDLPKLAFTRLFQSSNWPWSAQTCYSKLPRLQYTGIIIHKRKRPEYQYTGRASNFQALYNCITSASARNSMVVEDVENADGTRSSASRPLASFMCSKLSSLSWDFHRCTICSNNWALDGYFRWLRLPIYHNLCLWC